MKPVRRIPDELYSRYSMAGQVRILYSYCDDARQAPTVYPRQQIDATLSQVASGEMGHYGGVDAWLHAVLGRHPIQGLRVAIMGSADQGFGPWYECFCFHYGGIPVTIDYNPPRFPDSRFKSLSPLDYEQAPMTFAAAFSISSFEHDGLGRYGDPINPDGDLEAMRAMKRMLEPGGLLFLAVPLGVDKVVFNEHRIYGRVRLPLLLTGWTVVDSEGYDETLLDRDTGLGWEPKRINADGSTSSTLLHPEYPEYAPILVLRND